MHNTVRRAITTVLVAAGMSVCVAATASAGALEDLKRGFERTCMANAATKTEFYSAMIEKSFKSVKSATGLRTFWQPGSSCKVEFHFQQSVTRGPDVTATVQGIAVTFAKRVKGTIEHRRKGKRNEYFKIETPGGVTYSIGAEAERSGRVTGLSISRS